MGLFIIAAIVGLGVGILSGLLGIGGGTIMVPLFRLVFGMDAIGATATSLFTIVPTSISGMVKHIRNKTSVVKIGVVCGLFGACFSPLGVLAANHSPSWLIMVVAAVIVAYSAITMLSKAFKKPEAESASSQGDSPEEKPAQLNANGSGVSESSGPGVSESSTQQAANDIELIGPAQAGQVAEAAASSDTDASLVAHDFASSFRFTFRTFIETAVIGLFAGFMSGYVGVGGGFIMVPMFTALLGVPMRLASGTSLTAVCILAIPGVVEQGLLGNIDFAVGIAMAVGSIPGAVIGAELVKRIPERMLRIIFASFLLVVAVILVLNETGVLA